MGNLAPNLVILSHVIFLMGVAVGNLATNPRPSGVVGNLAPNSVSRILVIFLEIKK